MLLQSYEDTCGPCSRDYLWAQWPGRVANCSDAVNKEIVERLKPYFVPATGPSARKPANLLVTGNSKVLPPTSSFGGPHKVPLPE